MFLQSPHVGALVALLALLAAAQRRALSHAATAAATAAAPAARWLPASVPRAPAHDQLRAPDGHFSPPSLFPPGALVRPFDKAWRLRAAPAGAGAGAGALLARLRAPAGALNFACGART